MLKSWKSKNKRASKKITGSYKKKVYSVRVGFGGREWTIFASFNLDYWSMFHFHQNRLASSWSRLFVDSPVACVEHQVLRVKFLETFCWSPIKPQALHQIPKCFISNDSLFDSVHNGCLRILIFETSLLTFSFEVEISFSKKVD